MPHQGEAGAAPRTGTSKSISTSKHKREDVQKGQRQKQGGEGGGSKKPRKEGREEARKESEEGKEGREGRRTKSYDMLRSKNKEQWQMAP